MLGFAIKSREARYRASYSRYRIIKFLAENPREEFRREDTIQALPELDESCTLSTLNSLGEAEAIDYYSPSRDVKGKRASGWVERTLVKSLEEEEIISNVRKETLYFTNLGDLRSVIKYINENSNDVFEYNRLSEKLGIYPTIVSHSEEVNRVSIRKVSREVIRTHLKKLKVKEKLEN